MITRFAPSPTGPLHLGHAFAALYADELARRDGGQFLLRIEDIDQSRARAHWETQIFDDLGWLGLHWPKPVMRQSERQAAYDAALDLLWGQGLLYPCACTRRDIAAAASAPQEGAPLLGPDGVIYPGTCRHADRTGPRPKATLRLDMAQALRRCDGPITYFEGTSAITVPPDQMLRSIGDPVIARRDMGTSYHLAVVVDDAAQGITDVTRGADLSDATPIHVLLQRLLGVSTPVYHHHRLIRDDTGKRLAKRDDARAIRLYRDAGQSPDDIRRMIGL